MFTGVYASDWASFPGGDGSGPVSFDFEVSSTEDIHVTVWKPGYVTYSGVIEVEE